MVHIDHWKKMKYGTGKEDNECRMAILQLPVRASEKAKRVTSTVMDGQGYYMFTFSNT